MRLKTDGSETRCFGRPDFAPYKEGSAPEGFVADASHERGGPSPGVQAGLTSKTHPAKFVALMGWDKKLFSFIRESTNEYAAAKGAGSSDHYPEYKSFSVAEIVCCFGLLLRNGLNPYPQMDKMFEDPAMSFVWGDERARKALPGIGCGGPARRFNQFRSFCHVQSYSPNKKSGQYVWTVTDASSGEFKDIALEAAGPMNKLEPMLSYCRYKWQHGWLPGKMLSLDEMTMGFKGRCAMVTRIKYKKEGDGFQCDCICEDGYCFTFWFRCDRPPTPTPKDVSERDNRCSWLVDQLPGQWYRLFMDNLFTSWKFGEMLAARKCLFAGTCQTADWRGLHSDVIQKAVTGAKELEKARGTLLASVRADGMPENCEVICASYYDENAEKPFHMMTNVVEGIEVIEIKRKCFSTATMKHFYVTILRLSLAHIYNNNMNSVDIADQLRNHYRPDGLWLRNRKWWWSVMLWCLGQAVVNGYMDYKRTCERERSKPMTHLEFQEQVATAWCMTPMLILDESKASAATAKATANQTPAATASSSASAGKERGGYLTPKRLEACAQSYKMNPAMHVVGDVQSYERDDQKGVVQTEEWTPKCQICNKGLCKHSVDKKTVGKRCQIEATMCCTCCNVLVCSGFCWKVLHGYA